MILKQLWAVIRLEVRKSFFSKRSAWIYLLALAPILIFGGHTWERIQDRARRVNMAAKNPGVTQEKMRRITSEMKRDEVIAILGEPPVRNVFGRRGREGEWLRYSDGNSEMSVRIRDGEVEYVRFNEGCDLGKDTNIFAIIFQFFYLRLMLFFGCVFVFVNLFRGEMLDKSLHYYFLAPVRREVVVAGKYLAGLIATTFIFGLSTLMQILIMNLHFDPNVLDQYLNRGQGWHHAFAYLGVTALAVVGYGSVFLAGGILLRNPLIPAAAILIWETINGILPSMLRKFSIIYYLKSLCPVDVPIDRGVPPPIALLALNVEPVAPVVAVLGLIALATVLVAFSGFRVRRLEINYGSD